MKNNDDSYKRLEESTTYIPDSPETDYEMLNKYGTYEIQPTSETENFFPAISQEMPEKGLKPTNKNHGIKKNGSSH